MRSSINILGNKLFWVLIVYGSTMFLPWREIKKSEGTFLVLPFWWEYGNPINNYFSIIVHIALSVTLGISIAAILKWGIKKLY